jgi:hypothetical protein
MRTVAVRAVLLGSILAGTACALVTSLDGFASSSEKADANAPGDDATAARRDDASPPIDGAVKADGGCPPAPADPTLLAWYPFEEGTGNRIVDCSGHGRDGTLGTAGVFKRVPGRIGGGIDLDGNGACFDLGPAAGLPSGTEPFTLAAWVRPRRFGGPPPDGSTNPSPRWFIGQLGNSTGVSRGYGLGTDDLTEIEFKIFPQNGAYEEAIANIVQNAWVHVAGVFAEGKLRLYVLAGTPSENPITVVPAIDPGAHAWLGCRLPNDFTYDGELDDVRIYSRALSVNELDALTRQ